MKTLSGILFISLILISCEFNQSVNKDFITGAYSRGDGIGCSEMNIEVNNKTDNRNHFVFGEKVQFMFNNVTGLVKENNLVYPGLSMAVVQNEKDTVLQDSDLLASLEEGTDLSPLLLKAHFVAALPCTDNEKYKVFIKIWDKKGDGIFNFEMPFTVGENELLNIDTKDMSYSNIYLWDESEKLVVVDENVKAKNQMILILEGIDGLEVIDDKVYPAFQIELTDQMGNVMVTNQEILVEYETTGVKYKAFKEGQLPITITFPTGQINNPCKLTATLTDLKSDKKINIDTELTIE